MINILYLHETSQISGAEQSLLNLLRNLNRQKFNPLFVLSQKGPLVDELNKIGVETALIAFPKIRCCLGVSAALRRLRSLISEKNISIVHSNSIRTHLYGAWEAKRNKVYTVWHQRNMLQKETIDLDRLFMFLPDRIICNSQAIAKRFEFRGRIPSKVKVVFNGVDTGVFNPFVNGSGVREELGIIFDEVVIGISSRFNQQKGHEIFFQAAAVLFSQNPELKKRLRFLVAGGTVFASDKHREQYLKSMARDLGLEDRVVFSGYRRDMPQVYAAMDIFVLASKDEACGRVVLEAMSTGKPVIGTDSGGTPEMIENGASGILFSFGDYRDLAQKILYLIHNPDSAKNIGQAGRKRIEENFTIQTNVSKIEAIYNELLGEARWLK